MGENLEEIIKWGFGVFIFMLMLATMLFGYNVSQINNYQQELNVILQAGGGFNDQTNPKISALNQRYDNHFSATGTSDKVGYGETITYTINAKIPVTLYGTNSDGKDVVLPFQSTMTGQTTSEVGSD